jgi:chemotaxis signal transduction protein
MRQLLIIPTDRKRLGWPVQDLSEVTAAPDIHPLPEAYPHLKGTALHRGQLLSVVDLWSLLDMPASDLQLELCVRLAPPRDNLAVLIPGVDAVIPFSEMELKVEEAVGMWAGLYPWQETWVSVIQPDAVAEKLNQAMAEHIRERSGRMYAA